MTDTAVSWLQVRIPGAPSRLREAMENAVAETPGDLPVADRLAAAALQLYETAARGGGLRDEALGLLAADALLTHAFEAQTEVRDGDLRDFAARWGGSGRLADLAGEVCE